MRNANGDWQEVAQGGTVTVAANKAVMARVKVTNLGFAKWLAKGDGAVSLTATAGSTTVASPLKADVANCMAAGFGKVVLPASPNAKTPLTLSFRAEGRVAFGHKFAFFVQP